MASVLLVKVIEHPMTDGSKVHNVIIVDKDENLVIDLPAMTEECAYDLQQILQAGISSKTLCAVQIA